MDTETLVARLAVLWDGLSQAGEPELDTARETAAELCVCAGAGAGVLSSAWRLTEVLERRLGLPPGDLPELSRGRSAAVSARHSASLLLADLQDMLRAARPPVVVFSEIGVCHRVFGRHDIVAPEGAVVVPLAGGEGGEAGGASSVPLRCGLRWGHPGAFAPFLGGMLDDVELEGCRFLLPPLEVQTARLGRHAAEGNGSCGLLFATAALRCRREGRWEGVEVVAGCLGWTTELHRAVARWQVDSHGNGLSAGLAALRSVRRALGG